MFSEQQLLVPRLKLVNAIAVRPWPRLNWLNAHCTMFILMPQKK